jgi:hypothetical protein
MAWGLFTGRSGTATITSKRSSLARAGPDNTNHQSSIDLARSSAAAKVYPNKATSDPNTMLRVSYAECEINCSERHLPSRIGYILL